jgi:glyoxylase-like metal-dependent hydrolase (beta-lactamase superfamily II)
MKQISTIHLKNHSINLIDLNFQGLRGAIACYLIPHRHGALLVESGPASTISALERGIRAYGFSPEEISDVLLTHIHLDHAGAAGWLAQKGARIHVHPNGANHLVHPEKLLQSAERLYGDQLIPLFGPFYPVPEEKVIPVPNEAIFEIEDIQVKALDTPGHANHHHVYKIGEICFSGDVGGVRLSGLSHVRTPMVPPEFQLEDWRASLHKLGNEQIRWIAPTHFGFFDDPYWQISAVLKLLDDLEDWMETTFSSNPSLEQLNQQYLDWIEARSTMDHLTPDQIEANEAANPSWLSPLGIARYWKKYRQDAKKTNP